MAWTVDIMKSVILPRIYIYPIFTLIMLYCEQQIYVKIIEANKRNLIVKKKKKKKDNP